MRVLGLLCWIPDDFHSTLDASKCVAVLRSSDKAPVDWFASIFHVFSVPASLYLRTHLCRLWGDSLTWAAQHSGTLVHTAQQTKKAQLWAVVCHVMTSLCSCRSQAEVSRINIMWCKLPCNILQFEVWRILVHVSLCVIELRFDVENNFPQCHSKVYSYDCPNKYQMHGGIGHRKIESAHLKWMVSMAVCVFLFVCSCLVS